MLKRLVQSDSAGLINERTKTVVIGVLLVIRGAYIMYGSGVVALNLGQYRTPDLAVLTVLTVCSASLGLGVLIWHRRAIPLEIVVLDSVLAALGLAALAAAMHSADRLGSLNWMLAYAVACAIWLALGPELIVRLMIAAGLGAGYLVSTLAWSRAPDAEMLASAIPNALSPVIFFCVAVLVFLVIQQISAGLDAAHSLELSQKAELAALRERAHLFQSVHGRAIEALECIAHDPVASDADVRSRARAASRFLRDNIRGRTPADGFKAMLASLVEETEARGLTLELIDEEVTRQPGAQSRTVMIDWLRETLHGLGQAGEPTTVRIRAFCSDDSVQVVVRIPHPAPLGEVTVSEALGRRIIAIGGETELSPMIGNEARLRASVPL